MPAHAELPPHLLDAARKKRLTVGNTRPGTPERRAVDRVRYLERRALAPGISARKATGHGRTGKMPAYLAGEPRSRQVVVTYGESRRVGQYNAMVQALVRGRMSPEEFDRKLARMRPLRVQGGELSAGTYEWSGAAEALAQSDTERRSGEEPLYDVEGS